MSTPNLYAEQARRRKAATLADYCRQNAITGLTVMAMDHAARCDLCADAGVRQASADTWSAVLDLLGLTDQHETFVSEGGLSNFTVRCMCGQEWGVATFSREVAERSAAEHSDAYAWRTDPNFDPFKGLA